MLSHYRLYTWVSESIEHVLDHPSSNWWSHLIRAVAEVVELGIPGMFQFDSLEFFPAIDPPKSYTWLFQKRQNDQCTANTLLASRIIFHWLGLPMESDDRHRVQLLFLKSIMDSCRTPSVLLLDEVWNAYNAPSHLCSIGIKRALPSKSAMKKLDRAFLEHPILGCERSSEIDELFTALHSAHCLFIGLSTTSSASNPGMLAPSPQSPSLSTALPASSFIQTLAPTSSITSNLPLQNPRVTFFHDWLLEIAEIYVHSSSLSQDALTIEQRRILNNPDSSCPF
ncbi:hypothetical protein C8R41DRAFT_916110 [Lentinula lateritia]|uniref:Uncharacterized protein n=1 Tax=Lentinula lateritia TaxID=40482 RepID=A0ABQ8VQD6_9AGAR|nr:hypothetical protein C8R41DRAFT_916110 [Lentinula lateritia]